MLEAVPNDTSSGRTSSINKVITTADQMMGNPDGYRCYKDGVDVSQAKKADETQCYSASAIGDGAYLHLDDHTNGLATLARMGSAIPYTYISSIQNAAGKTFYTFKQPKGVQIVRQDAAYIVDDMTGDPAASYLAGSYKWHHYNGWETSIKTGTTNNNFDGLMMAWNTQYAVGSWVGYHTRNQALTTEMEYLTTPITRNLMEYALDSLHTKPVNYTEPAGIQHLPAYRSALPYKAQGPAVTTDIYPSWYKPKAASSSSSVIDKVTNKLATNCTPPAAKETVGGNAAPNTFSIDIFYPPGQTGNTSSANTQATDDVHNCSDNPPTINLSANSNPDGSYSINAFVAAGTHPFNDSNYPQFPGTITYTFNGQTIRTQSVSDPQYNDPWTFNPTASGTLTATVTDSVLYSASATATINFTQAAAGPQNLHIDTATTNKASWSGGQSGTTYTLTRKDNGHVLCQTTNTSCPYDTSIASGTTVVLTDNSGDAPDSAKI
jgi:membrane carboxypeptidase/penicillin-binding protein PbpC